ncbi:hypothetical protein [Hoeflea poritis]|uniref:Uncharacterized protein n=1 Tax=Hoeflea poritis TaxID=2993659 RepID=A0ABT4VNW1_9HYPH|nr:hypothetical protein [Hoeflea poritis]MDA4846376.1 hypothetical protein [Hoeflea poritis]
MSDTTSSEQARGSALWGLPGLIAACVIFAFGLVMLLIFEQPPAIDTHRYILPVLIGLVAFPAIILSIIFCAWVMSKLSLTNSSYAFGLPQGTIRAVLALGFIVLVLIFGVFVLTEADKTSRILVDSQEVVATKKGTTIEVAIAERFTELREQYREGYTFEVDKDEAGGRAAISVWAPVDNSAVLQLSQQVLTMLATALTAIVGFYFGSRSSSTTQATNEQAALVQEAAEKKLEIQAAVDKANNLARTLPALLKHLKNNIPSKLSNAAQMPDKLDTISNYVDTEIKNVSSKVPALTLNHEAIGEIRKAHKAATSSLANIERVETAVNSVVVTDLGTWKAVTDLEIPMRPG